MPAKDEWTIGVSIDVQERAKKYCDDRKIQYKDYANIMLDPSRIIGDLEEEMRAIASEVLEEKTFEELIEILVQKKIRSSIIDLITDKT